MTTTRRTALLALVLGCAACAGTGLERAQKPRNVILFLGDGMGVSTVTAARIHAGQKLGGTGEEHVLPFETFPNVALVKTYNTDSQVADSAGTMSAIMTGEKTRIGVVSVSASVPLGDCAASLDGALPTLLELAEAQGIATGVVTTTRITHATPAATYAHSPHRDWEADAAMPAEAAAAGCRDIARQLVEFGHGDGIEVVLGGGRAAFYPAEVADPEYPDARGARADGRNLVEEWLAAGADRRYAWNRAQLDALAPASGPVLGLFERSHMQYEADRASDPAGEPSLAEMTAFALDRLAGSRNGYFLMVEGGRIDHGHHAGNAYRALEDAVAFAAAVQTAMERTDPADTLILVTADHSHTLTISGYPPRGNPILGTVDPALGEGRGGGDLPVYTTLGYANGPGYLTPSPDLSGVDTTHPDYRQLAAYPLPSETHGGEDVAAYARGPNADTLRGVVEQNELFEVLRGALLGQ